MKTRLCGWAGCNRLTTSYYCHQHQKEADKRKAEREKGKAFANATRSTLYQSPEWRRLSREVIREVGCCEKCGCSELLQVHHIIPVRLAPQLALERANLQVLCRSCHQKETAREINSRRKR